MTHIIGHGWSLLPSDTNILYPIIPHIIRFINDTKNFIFIFKKLGKDYYYSYCV